MRGIKPISLCISGVELLCLYGSTNGAGRSASAAIDAIVGSDYELTVLLGNGADGAFIGASAASDAIVGNLISHGMYLLQCAVP